MPGRRVARLPVSARIVSDSVCSAGRIQIQKQFEQTENDMLQKISSFKGYTLAASDGEIGNVRDVYFDSHEWTVRYLVVNSGASLLGREVLIWPQSLGHVDEDRKSIISRCMCSAFSPKTLGS